MNNKPLSKHPYYCKLDWGQRGVLRAAQRGDVLVIVDTLSFSTAVAMAVHHGGLVYPCPEGEDPVKLAKRIGGEAAVGRADVPRKGHFSLSPLSYAGLEPGTRIVLSSPNGATCSHCSRQVPHLFVGAQCRNLLLDVLLELRVSSRRIGQLPVESNVLSKNIQ